VRNTFANGLIRALAKTLFSAAEILGHYSTKLNGLLEVDSFANIEDRPPAHWLALVRKKAPHLEKKEWYQTPHFPHDDIHQAESGLQQTKTENPVIKTDQKLTVPLPNSTSSASTANKVKLKQQQKIPDIHAFINKFIGKLFNTQKPELAKKKAKDDTIVIGSFWRQDISIPVGLHRTETNQSTDLFDSANNVLSPVYINCSSQNKRQQAIDKEVLLSFNPVNSSAESGKNGQDSSMVDRRSPVHFYPKYHSPKFYPVKTTHDTVGSTNASSAEPRIAQAVHFPHAYAKTEIEAYQKPTVEARSEDERQDQNVDIRQAYFYSPEALLSSRPDDLVRNSGDEVFTTAMLQTGSSIPQQKTAASHPNIETTPSDLPVSSNWPKLTHEMTEDIESGLWPGLLSEDIFTIEPPKLPLSWGRETNVQYFANAGYRNIIKGK
jgi:hypothetical protein